jgi:hypothetical protein
VEAWRPKMRRYDEESYVPGPLEGGRAHAGQSTLFDPPRGPVVDDVPTRRSDPPTSRLAAAKALASGKVSARNENTLAFLRAREGEFTYREIAAAIGVGEAVDVMRRLNSLRRRSLVEKIGVRKCSTNGNEMTTWRAKR